MANENTNSNPGMEKAVVKIITLGVILGLIILTYFYFVWSEMSWDQRILVATNLISLCIFGVFIFGIIASGIMYAFGIGDTPFIASLIKFPTEWLRYKAALYEAKRNDMLTQVQLLERNEKARQDILQFIQIAREELDRAKQDLPLLVESKYNEFIIEFDSRAKEILSQYTQNEETTRQAIAGRYAVNRERMRELLFIWLKENSDISEIKDIESLQDLWFPESILEFVKGKSDSLVKQGFNLAAIEQFCKKKDTNEWIWQEVMKQRTEIAI